MKKASGTTFTGTMDGVQIDSSGIKLTQRSYITAANNTASVPAASFNTSTSILTIFLPGS